MDTNEQNWQSWGYETPPIQPLEIVEKVKQESARAIADWAALPDEEPCHDKLGYRRVSVAIPISAPLFHQLMNGPTGYRAHYAQGIAAGEDFNRKLVEAIAPLFIQSEQLCQFDHRLCQCSLLGCFSKIWFSKDITDRNYEHRLLELAEVLVVPQWQAYWKQFPKPWKGLLAPESPSIVLNGTFVSDDGIVYEQKPGRSKELFESGWT
jgi:hypothetical protein